MWRTIMQGQYKNRPISNGSALVQKMAWPRQVTNLYPKQWWPNWLKHICIVWPNWVNSIFPFWPLFAGWRWRWRKIKGKCPDLLDYDVITWKRFPHYCPFRRRIHQSLMDALYKGQWCAALMFLLMPAWTNNWINNREAVGWNIIALSCGHSKGSSPKDQVKSSQVRSELQNTNRYSILKISPII